MLARTYRPATPLLGTGAMNGYLSDRVQVTLLYRPFQSPANRSLRVPTVSLKRPTKQAPNADGFPSWEESVGFCERGMGSDRGHGGAWGRGAWGRGGHGVRGGMGRVDLGGCPPRPPTDPGLHITRTRFLIS